MNAYWIFTKQRDELKLFYENSLYAFSETESLIKHWRENKLEFGTPAEFGLQVQQPQNFGVKRKASYDRSRTLHETVYVRLISILEVYMTNVLRDCFRTRKDLFVSKKRSDKNHKDEQQITLSYGEALHLESISEVYNKIINKECQRFGREGLKYKVMYYKRQLGIDISGIEPGLAILTEYHDRRNLLVHQMGHTDRAYRKKYRTNKRGVSIRPDYLTTCFRDMSQYALVINDMVSEVMRNAYSKSTGEDYRELKISIKESDNQDEFHCFQDDYIFWDNDDLYLTSDILKSMLNVNGWKVYILNGKGGALKSFAKHARRELKGKRLQFNVVIKDQNQPRAKKRVGRKKLRIVAPEIMTQVKSLLPPQPWPTGIHKKVASDLGLPNGLVSDAIDWLIIEGDFLNQVDGTLIPVDDTLTKTP